MNRWTKAARGGLLLLLFLPLTGCFLLGAGAGAGAAVYLTDRGASASADASLETIAERTRRVFREMRIEPVSESPAQDGQDLEFKGTNGPLEVTVDLERKGPTTTLVQVSAKREEVVWNKDYARLVLERILEAR